MVANLEVLSQEFLFDWAGYFGVILYIGAYFGLQLGWIPGVGYRYATLNLIAALLVLLSLVHAFNMASALIQLSWIVISIAGITRIYLISRRLQFTKEEEFFVEAGMPGTPLQVARQILDAGKWLDAEPGFSLTEEGEPVKKLYFIAKGHAEVFVANQPVAEVTEGFVGEMNVIGEGPASASVQITYPSRLFCITGDNLRRLSRGNSETNIYIEKHLASATKHKLMQANSRLSEGG